MDRPDSQSSQSVNLTGLEMGAAAGVATFWQHANFAEYWFADSMRESKIAGPDARRREIIFAIATAESFIFEWARDLVLGPALDSLESYFPAEGRATPVTVRWKRVPARLVKKGLIAGVPTLGQGWTDFLLLKDYRNGLLHARASRPHTSGVAADSLPVPPFGALAAMEPGWPTSVVARLIVELMRAAKTPIPSWLKQFDTVPAAPGVGGTGRVNALPA
jgi:hypothetical protein